MKIIFLDIDGVLNTNSTNIVTLYGSPFIEESKIKLLKNLIKHTNAKVVLTSNWSRGCLDIRNGIIDSYDALDFILLDEALIKHGIHIMDFIVQRRGEHRGQNILNWIEEFKKLEYTIESMIVIDTHKEVEPFVDCLIQPNTFVGLTPALIEESIALLNKVPVRKIVGKAQ